MSSKPKTKEAQTEPSLQKRTEAMTPAPTETAMPNLWADPYAAMRRMHDEMNRAFENVGFGRRFLVPSFNELARPKGFDEMAKAVWAPQIEVLEREGNLVVRADLPGLGKGDVKVEIEDDLLTIKGERRSQKEEKNETFYRSERSYGSFYRSFRVPEGTDPSKIAATFKDGVLEVILPAPVKPESTNRAVEIQNG